MMVMASGVNFGFKKTLPHVIGINVGFPLMVIAVGVGAGSAFKQLPVLHILLKVVGAGYLIWLAYGIATAQANKTRSTKATPLSMSQAALFQLLNPKAWMMALGAIVTFSVAGTDYLRQIFIISLIFFVFGTPCTGVWLWFGSALKDFLAKSVYLRIFNVSMAVLLLSSLIPSCMSSTSASRRDEYPRRQCVVCSASRCTPDLTSCR